MIRSVLFCLAIFASPVWAQTDVIDETGINGKDTPVLFDPEKLAAYFPGMTVTPVERPNPTGGESCVFRIDRGGEPVFWADVGWSEIYTFSVWTEAPAVAGPNGIRIGETTVADLDRANAWECIRGYNEMQNTVSCMWWDESLRLSFPFDPDGFEHIESGSYSSDLDGTVLAEIRHYLNRPVQPGADAGQVLVQDTACRTPSS